MSNEIVKKVDQPLAKIEQRTINLQKSNYFEYINTLNLEQRIINISTTINGNIITSNVKANNGFYNLFVLDSEDFAKGYFLLQKEACLKYIDKSIKHNYSLEDEETIKECLKYPCLFANKNDTYKRAKNDQLSYFGYLAGIEFTDEACKFRFSIVSSLPQNIFNDNAKLFNMKESKGENELDNIHWSIKNINLVETIRKLGFNVAAY